MPKKTPKPRLTASTMPKPSDPPIVAPAQNREADSELDESLLDADARQLVAAMQSLPQVAAAHVLGISPRVLRDRLGVPRNPDGTYPIDALMVWNASQGIAARMDDQQRELGWLICDWMVEAMCPTRGAIGELIRSLGGGPAAMAAVMQILLNYFDAEIAVAGKHLPDRLPTIRRVIVCESCRKLRMGSRWLEGTPPADCVVDDFQKCPKCNPHGWQAVLQRALGTA